MSRKRWLLWSAVLAVAIGLATAVSVVESNAEAMARAFCDRFPIGSPLADVAAAARDAGHPRYRMIRADEISIAYIGVSSFSRHVCAFQGESGKVTKAWYVYLD